MPMRRPTVPPQNWPERLAELIREQPEAWSSVVTAGTTGETLGVADEYLSWDRLGRRPTPEGLTPELWWAVVKFARSQNWRAIPLRDTDGAAFGYCLPDPVLRRLHLVDQSLAGRVSSAEPDVLTDPATRDRYLFSSLVEEAIASSQIEGAATTREHAKEMIRRGRRPRDRSERMILNNYHALARIRELRSEPLSPELVIDLHARMTEGTLDGDPEPPHLRTAGDGVAVYDEATGELLHRPPPPEELAGRVQAMCDFANASDEAEFVHPVVRAILLYFWLAYDHPFVDGNGRTARALFYWSMLRSGYWLGEFVSISRVIRMAPVQYARSFLDVETDAGDVTYFLDAQLRVLERAMAELNAYLERKTRETTRTRRLLRSPSVRGRLNHRQIALLGHALRHPGADYTVQSHASSHGVTLQTSRTDLTGLEGSGLLERTKIGRAFHFVPATDLRTRLGALDS